MSEEETNRKHEELRLLYSISVGELANFKQQQWRVASYGLLLYAVIYWIANHVENLTAYLVAIFYCLVFLIAAVGLSLEEALDILIERRRERLNRIRSYFSAEFNDAWEIDKSQNSLLWMFQAIFLAGFISGNILVYMIFQK